MATSNFYTQDEFPLFASTVFDGYEYEDEETGKTLYCEGDYGLFKECEKQIDELNSDLKYYHVELRDGYYSGVQVYVEEQNSIELTKYYTPKEWRENRKGEKKYHGGYNYDYYLPYAERKRAEQRELKRIEKFCKTVLRNGYRFDEYGVSARFNNGETWYTKVSA